jgi:putative transposase
MLGEIFDPKSEVDIYEHCRPHWSQSGTVVFITFRTHDSIPRKVLEQWEHQKQQWLRQRGLDGAHWSRILPTLTDQDQRIFQKQFGRTRETFLDDCHGDCLLRRPELSQIVANSLLHFDGVRYRMGDFVVMPNHVHLLAVFESAERMRDQIDSWLHFTATSINNKLNRKGKFWQQEPFDHLVRSPAQYDYLRDYIANNPLKANLSPGEYHYHRYEDR